jgi:dihydroneopterin aldolase
MSGASGDYEISLRGMQFHTLVGVLPHEKEFPQPLEVDVTVWVSRADGMLDYRTLYAAVSDVVREGPVGYLEDTGEKIAQRVLAGGGVRRARVALRKPHVPLPGPLAHAEVVVERTVDRGER